MLPIEYLLPALLLSLSASAPAQGADCSSATAISGNGTWAYDTTTASTSVFDGGAGCGPGTIIDKDIFFQWTAPVSGDFELNTFGSSFNTRMSVHAGSACAAACLIYNDNTFGIQSQAILQGISAGDTFLVQIGGHGGFTPTFGPGVINVLPYVDPCAASNDDGFEDNDTCAQAVPISNGTTAGLFVTKFDPDHFSFCVAPGASVLVRVQFSVSLGDIDAFIWDANDFNCGTGYGTTALATGFTSWDNEVLGWTNNTGAEVDVILEVNVFVNSQGDCNVYDLVVSDAGCDGGGTGLAFCNPADANSTGAGALLTGSLLSGTGIGVHLECTQGPPNQIGYFLLGSQSSIPGISLGDGHLCLDLSGGSQFGRYNLAGTDMNSVGLFDASGVLQNLAGTAPNSGGSGFDVPIGLPTIGGSITPGQTWHFQLWYRDSLAGTGHSNLSNGLSVTF